MTAPRSTRRSTARLRSLGRVSLALAAAAGAAGVGACGNNPVQAPLRSLQSAGPVSFVCLGPPGSDAAGVARPLTDCTTIRTGTLDDFVVPHLYALVTQRVTGEVAVIDLTTSENAVLDQDPAIPGPNFLPVGALPVDIVSTPGGMATFVGVGEVNYEGIYALPSDRIRGGAPQLSSWPSCALPAAPGRMALLLDPATDDGAVRPRCDADYGAAEVDAGCEGEDHCHGDLALDAASVAQPGRYKLAVTLPSEGGIAIIDAQDLLDQEDGAYEDCPIDRWLPLDVVVPAVDPPAPPPAGAACVPQDDPSEAFAGTFFPNPAGIDVDGGLLFVADRGAPVIHRLDVSSPCEPVELPPLVPTSAEDPTRTVTTSEVTVSPLTFDLKRFVYAVDDIDGSIMTFDVSDGSSGVTPLRRPDAELNPFQPPDRIRPPFPPRALISLTFQDDEANPLTGATEPILCDNDPDSTEPGVFYRTQPGFEEGAGPARLRGVFTFAVLDSGDIQVIDVQDYDSPCRQPANESLRSGCEPPLASGLATTNEYTCRAISPHEPRSARFLLSEAGLFNNEPGVTNFPILFGPDGSLLEVDTDEGNDVPRMIAPLPAEAGAPRYSLVVGSNRVDLDQETGRVTGEHTLLMNLADPRAHLLNQTWRVTYEGPLPGFIGRFGAMQDLGGGRFTLDEGSTRFCSAGVKPQNAYAAELEAEGMSAGEAEAAAVGLADYVQIISEFPVEANPYWDTVSECSFNACQQAYGTRETPRLSRDLRIVEATQSRLELVSREAPVDTPLKCCFPGVVEFGVRTGGQWTVLSDLAGFLHHMTVSDEGTCRESCNPNRALLEGRVREVAGTEPVPADDPAVFRNPFFQFAIQSTTSERDMTFELSNQGAFLPLTLTVVTNDPDVQPTAVRFLPPTGELVVSDGSLDGISFLALDALAVTRKYN